MILLNIKSGLRCWHLIKCESLSHLIELELRYAYGIGEMDRNIGPFECDQINSKQNFDFFLISIKQLDIARKVTMLFECWIMYNFNKNR